MDKILERLFNLQDYHRIPFSRLIPSVPISLLQEVKQVAGGVDTWFYATSSEEHSPNHQCFPIIIRYLLDDSEDSRGGGKVAGKSSAGSDDDGIEYFQLQIDCLMHMGGMINISAEGLIELGNDTFSNNFFGYHFDDLAGKHISSLLVDFEKIMVQVLKSTDDGCTTYSELDTNTIYGSDGSIVTTLSKAAALSKKSLQSNPAQFQDDDNVGSVAVAVARSNSNSKQHSNSTDESSVTQEGVNNSGSRAAVEIIPGTYEMVSQHYDGGSFKVLVQIKEVFRSDDDQDFYFALWITLSDMTQLEQIFDVMVLEQEVEDDATNASNASGILGGKSNTTVLSSHDLTMDLNTGTDLTSLYEFGEMLGQGSYGSVNLARRKSDSQLVSIQSKIKIFFQNQFIIYLSYRFPSRPYARQS
jgi:hypothetical protein